ncbi:MAG: hypothetical protein AAGI23_01060 [Bacteroidota bacterium]
MENPLAEQLINLTTDIWELPDMTRVIDLEEVQRQQERHPSPFHFTEIVSEAINSFLYQMESSESPRDMMALHKGLLLEEKEAITAALKEAIQQGAIYLFPYDVAAVLEQHQLPFTVDDLMRNVEENWLFGFIMPALPDWYFLTFVHRLEPNDTYTTGFKKRPNENV